MDPNALLFFSVKVESGKVDGQRLCITGRSAGGYTTLAALAFRDTFKAGASLYGVSFSFVEFYCFFFIGNTYKPNINVSLFQKKILMFLLFFLSNLPFTPYFLKVLGQ
jgi:hypothetical protein